MNKDRVLTTIQRAAGENAHIVQAKAKGSKDCKVPRMKLKNESQCPKGGGGEQPLKKQGWWEGGWFSGQRHQEASPGS